MLGFRRPRPPTAIVRRFPSANGNNDNATKPTSSPPKKEVSPRSNGYNDKAAKQAPSSGNKEPSPKAKWNTDKTTRQAPRPAKRDPPPPPPTGAIIIARHAERLDFRVKREGSNWVPTAERPWDPPLSVWGHTQSRKLGRRLDVVLAERELPPITAVYSSPLIRCAQSAVEAIAAYEEQVAAHSQRPVVPTVQSGLRKKLFRRGRKSSQESQESLEKKDSLKVRLEDGLMESMREKWYQSWCLPESDSTWGGPKQPDGEKVLAKVPVGRTETGVTVEGNTGVPQRERGEVPLSVGGATIFEEATAVSAEVAEEVSDQEKIAATDNAEVRRELSGEKAARDAADEGVAKEITDGETTDEQSPATHKQDGISVKSSSEKNEVSSAATYPGNQIPGVPTEENGVVGLPNNGGPGEYITQDFDGNVNVQVIDSSIQATRLPTVPESEEVSEIKKLARNSTCSEQAPVAHPEQALKAQSHPEQSLVDDSEQTTTDHPTPGVLVPPQAKRETELHPMATVPIQRLLGTPKEVAARIAEEADKIEKATRAERGNDVISRIDMEYATSCEPIPAPYQWGMFETRRNQTERTDRLVRGLALRHPGESILLLAHGGACAHVYGSLTDKDWKKDHGISGYTSFDVYTHQNGLNWKDVVVNDQLHLYVDLRDRRPSMRIRSKFL